MNQSGHYCPSAILQTPCTQQNVILKVCATPHQSKPHRPGPRTDQSPPEIHRGTVRNIICPHPALDSPFALNIYIIAAKTTIPKRLTLHFNWQTPRLIYFPSHVQPRYRLANRSSRPLSQYYAGYRKAYDVLQPPYIQIICNGLKQAKLIAARFVVGFKIALLATLYSY